ncbi:helix-turn-helix domain-containing protein [Bordetella sp. N]|uniref:helix-turn-helix domain-containing protein n=1 Tax=Bordetella sp. N TaxID=1746199 RepID=UPI00071073D3|nr:helix-turn-helix domain-containing protein [Bordetella sp. N]ALM85820.1 DNA-binding protein [Bordetella sp. N]
MQSTEKNQPAPRVALPRPVDRALHRLGQEISTARRARRLSQEDLAQRIGTSLSTVRRMEDGHPGTALHAFLRALHVLGRLADVVNVLATENDALGMELMREQLPQRVRTSRGSKAGVGSAANTKKSAADNTDELEGF